MANQCAMIVGYLVPHRCPNEALAKCSRCGREFCEEHVAIKPGGMICLACEQGLAQPVLVPLVSQDYSPDDISLFARMGAGEIMDDTLADLS